MPLKPAHDGLNLAVAEIKFKHLTETISLLFALADEAGHEDLDSWVKSEDFDPDVLEEAGANYRKQKRYHNYEWVVDLPSGRYVRDFRVGLTIVYGKKRKIERVSFSAREWWGPSAD
jgi:hypothetical protein